MKSEQFVELHFQKGLWNGRTEEILHQGMDDFLFALSWNIVHFLLHIHSYLYPFSSVPLEANVHSRVLWFSVGFDQTEALRRSEGRKKWSYSIYNYWVSPCCASDWQWVYSYTNNHSLFLSTISYIYKYSL